MMTTLFNVYDNHMYAQRIKNTSESDPRSYEATEAVYKQGFLCICFSCFIIVTIIFTCTMFNAQ